MEKLTIEQAITKLKELLSPSGNYSVCRKDKQPMGLGDQMIVGEVFENIDNLLNANTEKEQENINISP